MSSAYCKVTRRTTPIWDAKMLFCFCVLNQLWAWVEALEWKRALESPVNDVWLDIAPHRSLPTSVLEQTKIKLRSAVNEQLSPKMIDQEPATAFNTSQKLSKKSIQLIQRALSRGLRKHSNKVKTNNGQFSCTLGRAAQYAAKASFNIY